MYMYNDVLREAKERHRPGHPEMGVSKDRQWGGVGGVGGRGLRSAWVDINLRCPLNGCTHACILRIRNSLLSVSDGNPLPPLLYFLYLEDYWHTHL